MFRFNLILFIFFNLDRGVFNFAELSRFVASLPLNSFARDLQLKISSALGERNPSFQDYVREDIAFGYYLATSPNKQMRKVDELLRIKNRIESSEDFSIMGLKKLDYERVLPRVREFIR